MIEGALRRQRIEEWFQASQRVFQWRKFAEPWSVFVAEMLLRRTRAAQVESKLGKVLDQFPTPKAMAESDPHIVEEALRPFGLLNRSRSLFESARLIVTDHEGELPLDLEDLLALPGVGPYVALATLSVVANRSVVLTDTNTVRVASRVAGLALKGDSRRRKEVQIAISTLVGGAAPASVWWAVIDLAAQVCIPKSPVCDSCPINDLCRTAFGFGTPKASSASSRL